MASKISINLDTSKENYLVAKCKQNDDLVLEANIYENGLALDLTNKIITVQALKADNTYIIQNTDIVKENNKIIANLVRDFSRVPGTTKIEIVLVESGKQNTTFSFYLEVIRSAIDGAIESSNTVTIIENLKGIVVEAVEVRDDIEQLIATGNAATKADIIEVNTQLEQKANLQEILKSSNTFTEDLTILNDLDTLTKALLNKNCNITFWGDSITQGADAINESSMMYYQFFDGLRKEFPAVTFQAFNRGLGGRTVENASNSNYLSGTDFTAYWTSGTKSWRDYVKETNPDVLFIGFGMNAQTSTINGVTSLALIKQFIDTWEKKPTVILLTNWLPRKEWIGEAEYNKRVEAMRYTRLWAKEVGYNLLDIGDRYCKNILGTCENIKSTEKYLNFTQFGTNDVTVTNDSVTMTGLKYLWSKISALDFNVKCTINFTTGSIFGLAFKNGYKLFLYASGNYIVYYNTTVIINQGTISGFTVGTHTLDFTCDGANLILKVDGVQIFNNLRYYNMLEDVIKIGAESGTLTISNLELYVSYNQKSMTTTNHDFICGNYIQGNTNIQLPLGGNGVNHPNSYGVKFLYGDFIKSFLKTTKEKYLLEYKIPKVLKPILIKKDTLANCSWAGGIGANGKPLKMKVVQGQYINTQNMFARRMDTGAYLTFVAKWIGNVNELTSNQFTIIRDGNNDIFVCEGETDMNTFYDVELFKEF